MDIEEVTMALLARQRALLESDPLFSALAELWKFAALSVVVSAASSREPDEPFTIERSQLPH